MEGYAPRRLEWGGGGKSGMWRRDCRFEDGERAELYRAKYGECISDSCSWFHEES
jgi:hypothetical protein